MKTIDISGMGGSYELGCQVILQRALEFLEQEKPKESALTAEFTQKLMDRAAISDASGAMVGTSVSHALYIYRHGRDAWIKEIIRHRGEDEVYELPLERDFKA